MVRKWLSYIRCVKLEKDVSLYGYEMLRIIYTWQRQAPLRNHILPYLE
jgi:hypothetical protein